MKEIQIMVVNTKNQNKKEREYKGNIINSKGFLKL